MAWYHTERVKKTALLNDTKKSFECLRNFTNNRKKTYRAAALATHRAGKNWFSGAQNSMLPKASSGEPCAPRNFVLLVTLRGTSVHLVVYLVVHHMK